MGPIRRPLNAFCFSSHASPRQRQTAGEVRTKSHRAVVWRSARLATRNSNHKILQCLRQAMKKYDLFTFSAQARSRLATRYKLEPLPLLSPCYCDECRTPLTNSRILDERNGWCPRCKEVVTTSSFQVPSWAMGSLVFLFAAQLL
jgi:hypothetical protein